MTTPNALADKSDWRVRMLVGLYPPAWRRRYATEFAAMLDDSDLGVRQAVDIMAAAVRAWARPRRHLHDRDGRMRTTVAVTLCAWTALAAGAVLFAKATRDGSAALAGYGTVMAVALVIATTSSARGLRAAIAPTRGGNHAH